MRFGQVDIEKEIEESKNSDDLWVIVSFGDIFGPFGTRSLAESFAMAYMALEWTVKKLRSTKPIIDFYEKGNSN